ncbi:hypothetical protein ACIRSS_50060 [Amycolatopsis sp. NPDC101161]|uniref:hypothetical protein n=1 Tax=Amycolatopsis sp. NPDC101161 TaxID=3363940 RepID=UPI003818B9FB
MLGAIRRQFGFVGRVATVVVTKCQVMHFGRAIWLVFYLDFDRNGVNVHATLRGIPQPACGLQEAVSNMFVGKHNYVGHGLTSVRWGLFKVFQAVQDALHYFSVGFAGVPLARPRCRPRLDIGPFALRQWNVRRERLCWHVVRRYCREYLRIRVGDALNFPFVLYPRDDDRW